MKALKRLIFSFIFICMFHPSAQGAEVALDITIPGAEISEDEVLSEDLNGDGTEEIVLADQNYLYALNGKTGESVPGCPIQLGAPHHVRPAVNKDYVAILTEDGLEFYLPNGTWSSTFNLSTYLAQKPQMPLVTSKSIAKHSSMPVMIDVNGDGKEEVLVAFWEMGAPSTEGNYLHIFVVDPYKKAVTLLGDVYTVLNGAPPLYTYFEFYSVFVSFLDFTGDGAKEIVVVSNLRSLWTDVGYWYGVTLCDLEGQWLDAYWLIKTDAGGAEGIRRAVFLDQTGDGDFEIAFLTYDPATYLFLFDYDAGFKHSTSYFPSTGDPSGIGFGYVGGLENVWDYFLSYIKEFEVGVGEYELLNTPLVLLYPVFSTALFQDMSKEVAPGWPVSETIKNYMADPTPNVLTLDLDGDQSLDCLIAGYNRLIGYAKNGAVVWDHTLPNKKPYPFAGPLAQDVDGDGLAEVVVVVDGNRLLALKTGGSLVSDGDIHINAQNTSILLPPFGCPLNLIKNPSAEQGLKFWKAYGKVGIEDKKLDFPDACFVLSATGDALVQSVQVPLGANFLQIDSQVKCANGKANHGYPFLYVEVFDQGGGLIQTLNTQPSKSESWMGVQASASLHPEAKKLNVFLKRSLNVSRAESVLRNKAYFDDVTVKFCD